MKKTLVVLPLIALFGAFAAGAGEPPVLPEFDSRQTALMNELHSLSPSWIDSGGEWMLDSWAWDLGLEKIVVFPTAPGNAARHFKRLEEVYPAEKEAGDGMGDSAGLLELLKAAGLADCSLAPDFYPEFVSMDSPQPDFMILRGYLRELLDSAERQEMLYGNPAEAQRRYQAGLLCGWHLARDRGTVLVYLTGLIFQLRSAQGYEMFLRRQGRSAEARDVRDFLERLAEVLRLLHWKANSALGAMDGFACLPATLEIAFRDKEPCWRSEAVLKLAILRHGAPNAGLGELLRDPAWEKAAEEGLVRVAAEDPEERVRRLAAWAAVSVRPDKFENLRHRF